MRCSPKLLLLPGVILLACIEGLAQGPVYHMGRPPKAEEPGCLYPRIDCRGKRVQYFALLVYILN